MIIVFLTMNWQFSDLYQRTAPIFALSYILVSVWDCVWIFKWFIHPVGVVCSCNEHQQQCMHSLIALCLGTPEPVGFVEDSCKIYFKAPKKLTNGPLSGYYFAVQHCFCWGWDVIDLPRCNPLQNWCNTSSTCQLWWQSRQKFTWVTFGKVFHYICCTFSESLIITANVFLSLSRRPYNLPFGLFSVLWHSTTSSST